jgi:hypothetical protein
VQSSFRFHFIILTNHFNDLACSLLSLKTKPCNTDAECPDSLSCKDLNVEMGDFDWLGRYIGLWNANNATNQCTLNGNEIHSVTRRLLLTYFGIEYDGSSDNKYCMIDYDHVRSQVSTVSEISRGETSLTICGSG